MDHVQLVYRILLEMYNDAANDRRMIVIGPFLNLKVATISLSKWLMMN